MSEGFHAWARAELMGRRSYWGLVSEQQVAGMALLRVEAFKLGASEPHDTVLFPPASVYCLTPCSEEHARLMVTPYMERPEQHRELEPSPWHAMDVDVDADDFADADNF